MGNSDAGLEAKLYSRLELRAIIISLSLSLTLYSISRDECPDKCPAF